MRRASGFRRQAAAGTPGMCRASPGKAGAAVGDRPEMAASRPGEATVHVIRKPRTSSPIRGPVGPWDLADRPHRLRWLAVALRQCPADSHGPIATARLTVQAVMRSLPMRWRFTRRCTATTRTIREPCSTRCSASLAAGADPRHGTHRLEGGSPWAVITRRNGAVLCGYGTQTHAPLRLSGWVSGLAAGCSNSSAILDRLSPAARLRAAACGSLIAAEGRKLKGVGVARFLTDSADATGSAGDIGWAVGSGLV